jgi:hypothetical protein
MHKYIGVFFLIEDSYSIYLIYLVNRKILDKSIFD